VEHTWDVAGPLGLKLQPRGLDKDAKGGVKVADVTNPALPAVIKGLVIEEVAGDPMTAQSYNTVLAKLKAAGRPLTIKFSPQVIAAPAIPTQVWATSTPASSSVDKRPCPVGYRRNFQGLLEKIPVAGVEVTTTLAPPEGRGKGDAVLGY
jgi:hypothetical protein